MNEYDISLSDGFVEKIKGVIADEDNASNIYGLRAGLTGGGCSGMQYTFSLAEHADEGDVVVEKDGLRVIIDAISIAYMEGSSFDYKKALEGEQIVIKSPKMSKSCGCGQSVSPN